MQRGKTAKMKTPLLEKLWNGIDCMLRFVLIRVLHIKALEPRWEEFMRFVKFGIVGLSNTMISYIVYLIGIFFGMNYLAASILGFVISIINAFYWNNKYVFEAQEGEKRSLLRSLVKTFFSYAGTGLVLANILLVIQVRCLGISQVLAPLINLLITIPINYILNKIWVFSAKRNSR